MRRAIAVLLLTAMGIGNAAENLAPAAVVVHDHVNSFVRREGEPFVFGVGSELTDGDGKTFAASMGKCRERNVVELWWPVATPPRLERLRFQMGVRKPIRYRVQAWTPDGWEDIAVVDEANPVGPDVSFPAREIRGLRLVIEKTYGIGFDRYRLHEVAAFGEAAGALDAPVIGWDFSTDKELNVFELGEEVVVKGRVSGVPADAEARLTWEWVDWFLRPVSPTKTQTLTPDEDGAEAMSWHWQPPAQGPYFLRATLWCHDAVAGQSLFLVGIRDPRMDELQEVAPYLPHRGGRVRDEQDLVGPGKMIFSSEINHHSSPFHNLPGEAWFEGFAEANVDIVSALPNFEAVMPLPGVYNFGYIDHVVDLAEKHGMLLEAGFWRYWFRGAQRPHWWLEDELIVDQHGNPGSGFNHAFSHWGPRYREYVERTVRLVVRRYRQHPAVGVWNFQPFGHVDWGWLGNLRIAFDYSEPTQVKFREWLREERGLDLAAVSARYGQDFATWDEVRLPVAPWMDIWQTERTDHLLDDRPIWLDFVEFRHWTTSASAQMVYDTIRAEDPVRPFGAWMAIMAGKGEAWNRLCAAYGVPGGSNGAEWTEYTRMSLVQRRAGRHSRQEHGGQIDARREDPIWEMHNMIFNNNIFQTKYFNFVFPTFEENTAWHEVFANPRCRQLLTDMSDAAIPHSPVAALHSYDSNWFEGRNSYSFIELDRWWRMLTYGTYMTDERWIEWYSNGGDLTGLKDARIVIDNHSRLMRPEAEDALYDYVLGGGKLVLWANSGQLTYGDTRSQWQLLRRLGYANVAALAETRPRGELVPLPGNGVFTSFERLPVADWTPLRKDDATVLATVDGEPGAITWSVGAGDVLLLTGEEGAPDLGALIETEVNDRENYWATRVGVRQEFIATVLPLYRDVVGFAGELPPPAAEISGNVRGYHKQKGLDIHFVCLLNEGREPAPASVVLRLPAGNYRLSWWSLDGVETLPERTAAQLAAGIDLPPVPARRMRTLRLERMY